MFHLKKLFLGVVFLFLLVGCTSPLNKQAKVTCPEVGVLEDLSTVKFYDKGQKHRNDGLIAQARITDFQGGCHQKRQGVSVDFDMTIMAEKGPKLKKDVVKVEYFVAITNHQKDILKKEIYTSEIAFSNGVGRAGSVETLSQFIPLNKEDAPDQYEILVGFQPSEVLEAANQ